MLDHNTIPHPDLEQLIAADAEARAKAAELIAKLA